MRHRLLAFALILTTLALAACSASAAATPTPAPTAAPTPAAAASGAAPERLSGTVKSIAGSTVTLADGKSFALAPQARITRLDAAAPADLKSGAYVAVTAKRQTDNTLLASRVNIFAESMRGLAPGQRPMTEGNLMTNATIDQVQGDTFTVTWDGGGARVKLAPDAQITRIVIGSPADLKEGTAVTAAVANGVAQQVSLQ